MSALAKKQLEHHISVLRSKLAGGSSESLQQLKLELKNTKSDVVRGLIQGRINVYEHQAEVRGFTAAEKDHIGKIITAGEGLLKMMTGKVYQPRTPRKSKK